MTSGNRNVGVGDYTLTGISSLSDNTAVGYTAMQSNNVSQSTAIGSGALRTANGCIGCVAIGYLALGSNANAGTLNTALGGQCLSNNTTGSSNTGVGLTCLNLNTTGSFNTSGGLLSMDRNTTGSNNAAWGYGANSGNVEGNRNSSFGNLSMDFNIHGSDNTAVGNQSLAQDTACAFNTVNWDHGHYWLALLMIRRAYCGRVLVVLGSSRVGYPRSCNKTIAIG